MYNMYIQYLDAARNNMCVVSRACNHIERVISHCIDNDEGLLSGGNFKEGGIIDRF